MNGRTMDEKEVILHFLSEKKRMKKEDLQVKTAGESKDQTRGLDPIGKTTELSS